MTDRSEPRPQPPAVPSGFNNLSPAVWRASTVLFDSIGDFTRRRERLYDGYSYGVTGTPTSRELERRVAELEHAAHCVVAPSGQAALCMVLLAVLRRGDHLLVSDAAYGPLKSFAADWMAGLGVDVDFYPPTAGAEIASWIRPKTRLSCAESPASLTMEMQDLPAVAEVARRRGVLTMVDNTWATPLGFRPLDVGIDFSVEAASKMMGGHSDVLLGSVATSDRKLYERLRQTQSTLGQTVSPEDCFLVLRGLETMAMRVAVQGADALAVAAWLAARPEVAQVLFPPLPGSAGHDLWARDFRAAGCVLSLVPAGWTDAGTAAFFAALTRFRIGASWGGVHSLAALYPADEQQGRQHPSTSAAVIRLSIGLEGRDLLIADLEQGFAALHAAGGRSPA